MQEIQITLNKIRESELIFIELFRIKTRNETFTRIEDEITRHETAGLIQIKVVAPLSLLDTEQGVAFLHRIANNKYSDITLEIDTICRQAIKTIKIQNLILRGEIGYMAAFLNQIDTINNLEIHLHGNIPLIKHEIEYLKFRNFDHLLLRMLSEKESAFNDPTFISFMASLVISYRTKEFTIHSYLDSIIIPEIKGVKSVNIYPEVNSGCIAILKKDSKITQLNIFSNYEIEFEIYPENELPIYMKSFISYTITRKQTDCRVKTVNI